jgi:hypothetical protein
MTILSKETAGQYVKDLLASWNDPHAQIIGAKVIERNWRLQPTMIRVDFFSPAYGIEEAITGSFDCWIENGEIYGEW